MGDDPSGARRGLEMHGMEPGMRVRHPGCPDWGVGQVQSVVGDRVTVNFEHAGKVLLNLAIVTLEQVEG
jgi:FKBP-type peptidyl-prolyl cis-trans isomerase 2